VEYAGAGRNRVVKHFGSAHTPTELGILVAAAQVFLADRDQGVLEFDVDGMPRAVLDLVQPRGDEALFAMPIGTQRQARGRGGAPCVVGSVSRLLYEVLAGVYDRLGFDVLADGCFKDLVIARIVEPTSILDSGRVLRDLGRIPASYRTQKRTLTRCFDGQYRDRLAELCFTHAQVEGDISLLIYDVTTLYFEAEREDELRKVGFSNYAVCVVMPLVVVVVLVVVLALGINSA
jgi:hypothetical protein